MGGKGIWSPYKLQVHTLATTKQSLQHSLMAVLMSKDSTKVVSNVAFLTDSLSVIQELTNNKSTQLAHAL